MESKSRVLTSVVLLAALSAVASISPGLAHAPLPPHFPLLPGPFLPSPSRDVAKCWSSLLSVRGCVFQIYNSIFAGKLGNVGAACCKAFSTVDTNCWALMFPLNPQFPPLLRDRCARIVPNAPVH